MKKYDFLIIGAGITGYSAAVYAARFRMNTIVIGELPGGLITTTHLVENWPGIISISGLELAENLRKHAEANGVPIINDKVTDIKQKTDSTFHVKTSNGKEFYTKTILFATGTTRRKLGIKGEKEFENKGVSYCAVCDGALFRNKTVAVIGGSDSAAKESLYLSEHASKVYIIYRGEKIRAEPINYERVTQNKKIEIITKKNVIEIYGDRIVRGIKFKEGGELKLDGVFIEIGADPNSELAAKLGVLLNEKKEIIIDIDSKTNIPGIYAAGDVANRHFKQAITGSAEGVIAAFSAYEYINTNINTTKNKN